MAEDKMELTVEKAEEDYGAHSTRHRECYDETNALWVERSILQIYTYLYFYL